MVSPCQAAKMVAAMDAVRACTKGGLLHKVWEASMCEREGVLIIGVASCDIETIVRNTSWLRGRRMVCVPAWQKGL